MRPDIYLIYLLLRLFGLLPLRWLHGLGAGLGRLALRRGGKMARYTAVNMGIVRPDLNAAARAELVRQAMIEGGKSLTEIVKIWGAGAERALGLVREVRGEALFDAALASGKGVIIAAPHLGCWELLNYWLCSRTKIAIAYRPPRQPELEPLLIRARGGLSAEQVRAEGQTVRVSDGAVERMFVHETDPSFSDECRPLRCYRARRTHRLAAAARKERQTRVRRERAFRLRGDEREPPALYYQSARSIPERARAA